MTGAIVRNIGSGLERAENYSARLRELRLSIFRWYFPHSQEDTRADRFKVYR